MPYNGSALIQNAALIGGTTVVPAVTGIYRIGFGISTSLGIGATIQLLLNSVEVPGTQNAVLTAVGQVNGEIIVHAAAGSTIALQVTGASVSLAGGVNAYLLVEQLA